MYKRQLQALADPGEQGKISNIVGKTPSGQSAFGTLAAHIDTLVSVITGQSTESLADIAASEKANNTNVEINKTLAALGPDAALIGGQTEPVALLKQIEALHASLNQLREENRSLAAQLNDVQTNADLLAERARRREEQLCRRWPDTNNASTRCRPSTTSWKPS